MIRAMLTGGLVSAFVACWIWIGWRFVAAWNEGARREEQEALEHPWRILR